MYKNLDRILHEKRISRKTLAEILGISESTVQNKITGKTEFTFTEAKKTCSLFFPEYDVMWVFTNDQESA